MSERKTIDEFERAAEAAYAAMYEAKPYSVKDCYDDAQINFSHAIAAAKLAGLADEVERLSLACQGRQEGLQQPVQGRWAVGLQERPGFG